MNYWYYFIVNMQKKKKIRGFLKIRFISVIYSGLKGLILVYLF